MGKNQQWLFAHTFQGEPKTTDFELRKDDIPLLKDGEVLFEAIYLSVDPYMRVYAERALKPGQVMFGSQVARVAESKHADYKVGNLVFGYFGWQLFTVCNPDNFNTVLGGVTRLPDLGELPGSLALGVLGMPGNTAYFGFLEICKPKAAEVVVISGAAGAVGNIVGQIAKIKGCHVIGIAGSDNKLAWLMEELKFDGVINYKTQNIEAELKKLAPKGVDCYFDNVGGEISSQVIYQMNKYGRVSVCGSISSTNNTTVATTIQMGMLRSELTMEGFTISRWNNRWMEGTQQNLQWIKEGKLKYRETITEGFSNMPEAFIRLLKGDSSGKAVVKVHQQHNEEQTMDLCKRIPK